MIILLQSVRDCLVDKLYQWLLLAEQRHTINKNERWVSKLKKRGQNLHIFGSVYVSGAEHIEVGNNVHIGENTFIRASGGLKIGNNTFISRNLVLYTVNHQYHGNHLPFDATSVKKPVEIGHNVWIGMNVCITPGTKIGDGAIIGMGAVVSGEVPPLSIVGNQKFRILGYRDSEHYQNLVAKELYKGVNDITSKEQFDVLYEIPNR
ncbi:acyltransferase [Oculatella sp. LEGE 06141]|uniref:acyltransferase n=1 Tax=Oculatella sp. LEGE 06141 TaxID=1828648 RepID=UPI001880C677|nr:acyltransferase [Oculatella sp. LEGE 06141]MBE9179510.1 acyltransferase [Oculatella sp. LEGE 06141]